MLRSDEVENFVQECKLWEFNLPSVVISANEFPNISLFSKSKKVLIPHSIFIKDSTPTPLSLGFNFFNEFDFYFAPNIFYFKWILKSLIDVAYYDHSQFRKNNVKYIVPGGYLKKLPPTTTDFRQKTNGTPLILYVPSVFSPEHEGHRFHLDGSRILTILAKSFPQANLVCRPHPTDSNQKYIQETASSLIEYKNVSFDFSLTPDPNLYSKPDIVITDMSGFAFTHEFVTTLRPIFMINEPLLADRKRFARLVSTFGDIATSTDELIMLVEKKLNLVDSLKNSEVRTFRNLFLDESNNPNQLLKDLLGIKNSKFSKEWVKIPFLFGNT